MVKGNWWVFVGTACALCWNVEGLVLWSSLSCRFWDKERPSTQWADLPCQWELVSVSVGGWGAGQPTDSSLDSFAFVSWT